MQGKSKCHNAVICQEMKVMCGYSTNTVLDEARGLPRYRKEKGGGPHTGLGCLCFTGRLLELYL